MILALDTSVGISIALHDGCAIIDEVTLDQHGIQGELTSALISQMLNSAALKPADISQIVVGVGPGPYTGLRVGVATAQAFGFALGIPVLGICSLDAVGHLAGIECIAVSDARRKELYVARYTTASHSTSGDTSASQTAERLGDPWVATAAELVEQYPQATFVGPGAQLYPESVSGTVMPLRAALLADLVALGAAQLLPVSPMYLRKPDAQEPQARKQVTL